MNLQTFSDSRRLPELGGDRGKLQVEASAAARPAIDLDGATMLLNDTVSDRQAEARPFVRSLGGEKWIVNAMDMLRIDAVSAVHHIDPNTAVVLNRGVDLQHPARRHGVAGVDEQVQENLLQLAGIAGDGRRGSVQGRADLQARLLH